MTFNAAFQMAWSHCNAVTPPGVLQPGVCVAAMQVTLGLLAQNELYGSGLKLLFPTTHLSWI